MNKITFLFSLIFIPIFTFIYKNYFNEEIKKIILIISIIILILFILIYCFISLFYFLYYEKKIIKCKNCFFKLYKKIKSFKNINIIKSKNIESIKNSKFLNKFYLIKNKDYILNLLKNSIFLYIFFLILFIISLSFLNLDEIKNKYSNIPYFYFCNTKIYIIKIKSSPDGIFNKIEYYGEIIGEIDKSSLYFNNSINPYKDNSSNKKRFIDKTQIVYKLYNYKNKIKVYTNSTNLLKNKDLLLLSFSNPKYFSINNNTKMIYLNLFEENIFAIYKYNGPDYFSKFKNLIVFYSNRFLKKVNLSFFFASITGSKIFLNKNLYNNYSISGTSHILALSGLHLGIIAILLIFITSIFFIKRNISIIIILLISFFYLFITNFKYESLIRAYIMLFIGGITFLFSRKIDPLGFFSITFFVSFIFLRNRTFSISFILSISSIFAILIFYNILEKYLNNFTKDFSKNKTLNNLINFIKPFLLSLSISLIQAPIIIFYFNRINFFSFLINPFIIILFTINFYFSIFLLFLSFFNLKISILNSILNSLFYFQHYIVKKFNQFTNNYRINIEKINLIILFVFLIFIILIINTIQNKKVKD
jgi:competence protein ComEC